ncbi:subtilisin family serine protease [Bacillus pakistanensis]|uniref:Subtilisin family serine protease n=1 Tax=Rossellomorea pakistanensis TaxID=992288 RepID=A0ABS2NDW1_9BACI|nr:S8 family serine peptidase [Bacillus pakistanensis]MBM7586052.1 subtilisin family serine protease [Bacillus pakistanensis]
MKRRKNIVIKGSVLAVSAMLLNPVDGMTTSHAEAQSNINGEQTLQTGEPANLVHGETSTKIDQFLKELSPEQRKALQDLNTTSKPELNISPETNLNSSDEISVIVEFKQHTANTAIMLEKLKGRTLTKEEANNNLEASHNQFKKDLSQLKVKHRVKDTFKQAFNGVALTLPANQVETLLQSEVVKSVFENKQVQLIEPTQENTNTSPYSGRTPQEIMGVDKLHEEGLTGKNIKVGVLDTGIDYNHPDLKDAYIGGYDFVDDDNDPMETTYEDWVKAGKPGGSASDYITFHGTHVSGILAGKGKADSNYATKGVAPDADLYVYRVLGPYGFGSFEGIISGIEKSVEDGMDIINLSLSANSNDPYSPVAIAINNAVLSGVTCVLAAGNEGGGEYTLGTPAASALGITVGSSNPEVAEFNYTGTFKSSSTEVDSEIRYSTHGYGEDPRTLEGKTFDIIDVGKGLETDFNNIDVNGKIALVSTGTNRTYEKVRLAKQHGAAAVFIYGTYNGFIGDKMAVSIDNTYAYILSGEQGKAFKEILQNEKAQYTFTTQEKEVIFPEDSLSYFSSRGPALFTYDIKPEVTAPGLDIMSTVPPYLRGEKYKGQYEYGYARLSGTSMAAPQVAGVAALMLENNPKSTPSDIKTSLMNTAGEMAGEYSVFDVGAGRIDAYEAVQSEMNFQVIDETKTLLNGEEVMIDELTGGMSFSLQHEGHSLRDQRTILIENSGGKTKTFNGSIEFTNHSLDASENGIQLTFDTNLKVKAGKRKNTNVFLNVPKTAKDGYYEGYIRYVNEDDPSEEYQIPFSIRKVKDGVEYLNISSGITTINNGNFNYNSFASANLKLNSHMRSLDIFLADTNSEDIGYIGYYEGIGMPEGKDIKINPFFNGDYYPLGATAEQVEAMEPTEVKPGTYKVKFVFTRENGKQIIIEKPITVDNSKPELTTNLAHTVIEVDPDSPDPAIDINGNVTDQAIKDLIAAGSDITQAINTVYYQYNTNHPSRLPIDAEGNFTFERSTIPSYFKVLPVEFYSTDHVGNKSASFQYYFVKKGSPYVTSIANQKEVTQGETITFDVNAENQGVFKKAELEFKYDPKVLSFTEIALVETMKDRFDAEVTNENGTMKVTLQAKNTTWTAEDVLSLLQLKAEVKNDNYYNDYAKVYLTKADFTNLSDVKTASGRVDPSFKINAPSSQILGTMNGEAVYEVSASGPVQLFDYSTMGATVKVMDEEGNQYPGKVLEEPEFEVGSLPSTGETLKLEFDIPGHFTVHKSFYIGLEGNVGEKKFIDKKTASAGDVNKDHVIDILDAIYLEEHWGTNDRKGDINFDGTIDMIDMNYIKQNFLKENPTVPHENHPKSTENGKTLESIIDSLS